MTAVVMRTKTRPTNADLQDQIAQAHDCIHNVGAQVDAVAVVVQADREASARRDEDLTKALHALAARQAATDARVDLIVKFFGIRSPKGGRSPRRRITLGSLEWWQAVLGIGGSVLGALSAWKYLFPALVALHHAIMAK